ncbi:MAG: hypothetical protein QOK39_2699 [Acidimicrobiaceae bacterium]|jgi:uncharacterized protein (DUF885 family)|nr:hypothetical protein [Acidimicrobiaceae bacterium]
MPDEDVHAAVHRLAEDYWETVLEASPTNATILGDHRYDDRIEDLSAAGDERLRRRWAALSDRLAAVDRASLAVEDRATCAQLDQELGDAIAFIDERLIELQSDHMTGYHVGQLISAALVSAPDPESAGKLVERLRQFPGVFEQAAQRFRDGVAAGRTPARVAVERSLNMVQGYLDSPLEGDAFIQIAGPEAWDGDARWRATLEETVRDTVRPAYRQLATVLSEELLPVARDDARAGLTWLPDGDELYATWIRHHTTLALTPAEIHQFGLAEVTEKLPREYAEVGGRLFGVTETAEVFFRLGDEELRYATGEEIMAAARTSLAAASAAAPRWFGRLPRSPCAIEPVPDFLAADSPVAYYVPPAPDGSRTGTYFVNTANPHDKARYDGASIAYHEAIPGHHLQLTIASELTTLPRFRRFSFANAAYCEGWGLYSERLAEEMGLYRDDLDRIGMLGADSLRSCRLVVDTGLHALGWSRQRAIEFMAANTPMTTAEVVIEIDRYIAMPAQALSYKVGQREMFALRSAAQAALGEGFDIRQFHDAVLGSGSVGLPVLREVVEDWIARRG